MTLVSKFTALPTSFRTCDQVREELIDTINRHKEIAQHVEIGKSEEGRPIDAFILGKGKKVVGLLAGAHSDEPVGPETLRTFIVEGLKNRNLLASLYDTYRFIVIPHVNPDGESRNWQWMKKFPDVNAYIKDVFREPPGRDIEFGYPEMRTENQAVSHFLQKHAPFSLYINFHGMGFAEGVMLLIERHWIDETRELREQFLAYAASAGFPLHDHDRKGEKGFRYIAPGFSTTPEGRAMKAFFLAQGDEHTANNFHLSSMEFIRELGGNPLCLVTELPLFILKKYEPTPGKPETYLEFKSRLPEIKRKVISGEPIGGVIREYNIQPVSVETAIKFHLAIIEMALKIIERL